MRTHFFIIFTAGMLFITGCFSPNIKLFTDSRDPLREFTLQGKGKEKILMISVKGMISDASEKGLLRSQPSIVQRVVSQLRKAERDADIKAILLKINSPGGTVTASDILYHEIMAFKRKKGVKVTVAMMDLAASGAYYISLPADMIMAHPTTVTGSVGVIFMRPKVMGLMGKIGMGVEVNKSGKNKDMGSPFREATNEEQKIFDGLIKSLARQFIKRVAKHRNISHKDLSEISGARIYLAREARKLGLIDKIGYLSDAISETKSMAGLPKNAKVVVYRRTEYPDDNLYNTTMKYNGKALIHLGLPEVATPHTGFYYLWPSATGKTW